MADLLTHYVSARIPGGFLGDERARTTLALGVFLPDFLAKGLELIPFVTRAATFPSHSLMGTTCVAMALTMLFAEEFRLKAFVTLWIGQLLHIAVDLGKDSMGQGSAFLFHPFSLEGYDLGLYTTQDVFWLLPGNLLLLWLMRLIARRAQKNGWVWR